jgi:uncharacterized protein DUF4172
MQWNWQKPERPNFAWPPDESRATIPPRCGLFAGSAAHLDAADNDQLTVDALSVEAVATSEIAGEILDRATVQSSIRGLPIDDSRRI